MKRINRIYHTIADYASLQDVFEEERYNLGNG